MGGRGEREGQQGLRDRGKDKLSTYHISIWVYKWDDQKLKVVQKRGYLHKNRDSCSSPRRDGAISYTSSFKMAYQ